jgi:pilus assembly protein CpaE
MTGNWTMFQSELSQPETASPSGAASPYLGRSGNIVRSNPNRGEIDTLGASLVSVALISPDTQRRMAIANALAGSQAGMTREYSSYPELDEVPRLMQQNHDVVIVDLDSNPEYALDLVESICGHASATVMVCSTQTDPELMLRCMRAGAREYLTLPFESGTLAEALVRASVRRPAARPTKKTGGRLQVFFGAKGGSGVTLLACNYAIMLARESGQSTLLIDLDLPLGDAAITLGVDGQYSTVDALQNAARLDANFLSKLLRKYSPSLSVLAAPGKLTKVETAPDAIDRLIAVARSEFDNVVIDTGSRLDLFGTSVIDDASTIYLVTQVGIPELRNSNRLVTEFFTGQLSRLEIVLNRYESSLLGVDEEHIAKALTKPARWKIPNDRGTAFKSQNTASPLALTDHPISRAICQMARAACGAVEAPEKKKGILSIFG